jgi:hypothetical protein
MPSISSRRDALIGTVLSNFLPLLSSDHPLLITLFSEISPPDGDFMPLLRHVYFDDMPDDRVFFLEMAEVGS